MSSQDKNRAVMVQRGLISEPRGKPSLKDGFSYQKWFCWSKLLLFVVPILIVVIGIILRDIITNLIEYSDAVLTISLVFLFLLIFLILIIGYYVSIHKSYILTVLLIALGLVACAFAIFLIVFITEPWDDLQAWITIILLLGIIAAIAGAMIGADLVYQCKESRESKKDMVSYFWYRHPGTKPFFSLPFKEKEEVRLPRVGRRMELRPAAFKHYEEPSGWPNNIPWSPNRYSGPSYYGSNYQEIMVTLNKRVTSGGAGSNLNVGWEAKWYHNRYYASMSLRELMKKEKILKLYYKNRVDDDIVLPNEGTPDDARFGTLLLKLDSVIKSSQYGGSIGLRFMLGDEGMGYEFMSEDALIQWNAQRVFLDIFVVPTARCLNPVDQNDLTNLYNDTKKPVYAQLIADNVDEYRKGDNDEYYRTNNHYDEINSLPDPTITDPADADPLKLTLKAITKQCETDLSEPARRFVYGNIHTEFIDRIDPINPGDVIDQIVIMDNYLDIVRHVGEIVLVMKVKISNITKGSSLRVTTHKFINPPPVGEWPEPPYNWSVYERDYSFISYEKEFTGLYKPIEKYKKRSFLIHLPIVPILRPSSTEENKLEPVNTDFMTTMHTLGIHVELNDRHGYHELQPDTEEILRAAYAFEFGVSQGCYLSTTAAAIIEEKGHEHIWYYDITLTAYLELR